MAARIPTTKTTATMMPAIAPPERALPCDDGLEEPGVDVEAVSVDPWSPLGLSPPLAAEASPSDGKGSPGARANLACPAFVLWMERGEVSLGLIAPTMVQLLHEPGAAQ